MAPKILYEDDVLLVLDKPAGMVVNNAESVKGETVEEWLGKNFQFSIFNFQNYRHGIVHRIDKETSGILLVAKTQGAFEELQRQFKQREVEKTYLALVHGKVEPAEGTITTPVGRLPWNRERFGILPGGREAETRYNVVRSMDYVAGGKKKEVLNLVEFYPKTGRTHQIRVHAKSVNHPVVADEFYAGRKTARNDRTWCPRLFLHASKIVFTHPVLKKRMEVEAPLPQDLENVLKVLISN